MRVFQEVDIIAALRRIVDNNNHFYQSDFDYDTEELKNAAEGGRYLWLSRFGGTMLHKERDTYIQNHEAYHAWQYYSDTKYYGVRAFAVEVTENVGGRPFGNIYEIHYAKEKEAIARNRFHAQTAAVTFTNGDVRTFGAVEYSDNFRAIVNRYGTVQGVEYSLDTKDEARLDEILADSKKRREEEAEPANFGGYIRGMVRERFHEYGYMQDDMAFTTPSDANEAISHQLPVFILYPDSHSEQARIKKDVADALYAGRIFGMDEGDKRLLRFYKAGNTLADLPFTNEELTTIFHMAIERGKANIGDSRQQKAVDGIIKVLDTILFSDDGRDAAQLELDAGAER